jgi:AcrR family transcriptional regulator
VTNDDLTARARIRDAAREQFAEHGFERTTIRGIAAAAGVSPGLVRHHFGSKQGLKDAVDAHVVEELRRINAQTMVDAQDRTLYRAARSRPELAPVQKYLAQALVDGSTTMATLFDQMVEPTAQWFALADRDRTDPPYADLRTRAAVYTAMALGVPLLREHLSRVLGVDILSPEGDRLVALALLDIYSHPVLSPELAQTARDGLDAATPSPTPSTRRPR